jgi:DNA-binding beta-propeller fold protein YncE
VKSLLALALLAVVGAGTLPRETVARVPLPGPDNRFDYQSVDSRAHRLYIAHMDADTLLVVDTRSRRVVKKIAAPGVHGVIVVPSLGRVYASATNDHEALTIDSRTGAVLARAPAGDYPDGLAFDPVERHVFVSDESGGAETVLSAAGRRIATVPLGGDAGNVQYDAGSRMVLAAVQSRDVIAVIDPRLNRVVRTVSPPGCDHDHGLLVDAPRRLAFIACDGNATLLTLDLRTWKVTGSDEVGDDPDVLAFDGSLRRLYVAAESGVVAVFAERGRRLVKLGQAFLASSAHSVAVDPRTDRVYFPLERGTNGGPQLLVMTPRGR